MTLRTAAGKTALQIAKEKGHTECVAAVKTFLGEVAAVEAGGAGAGSASGGSSPIRQKRDRSPRTRACLATTA